MLGTTFGSKIFTSDTMVPTPTLTVRCHGFCDGSQNIWFGYHDCWCWRQESWFGLNDFPVGYQVFDTICRFPAVCHTILTMEMMLSTMHLTTCITFLFVTLYLRVSGIELIWYELSQASGCHCNRYEQETMLYDSLCLWDRRWLSLWRWVKLTWFPA